MERFLRGTGRIVSVVVYSKEVVFDATSQETTIVHNFDEIGNKAHRFDALKGWLLLPDGPIGVMSPILDHWIN
ncbi:MAG: hypothetical protein ACREEV_04600, partial [Dongiaceae bacterium]